MLRPYAHELATIFVEEFTRNAGMKATPDQLAEQVEKTAGCTAGKYSPPINEEWIGRVIKMGCIHYKLGKRPYTSLGALSASHRRSAEIIFEGAGNEAEGRRLVELFMRLGAMEVEILMTTIQTFQQEHHRTKRIERALNFQDLIARTVDAAREKSEKAKS